VNFNATIIRTAVLLTAGLFGLSAHADVIKSDGNVTIRSLPHEITEDFQLEDLVPTDNPLSSIAYAPGSISFMDGNEQPLRGINPGHESDYPDDWWHGSGLVYVTETDTMIVDFSNLYVTAFTFRLGANKEAQAWIQAFYSDDTGATGSLRTDGWFTGIGPDSSPEYGVFVTDQSSCRKLTSVVIDPNFTWGLGDMQIATSDTCTTQVPEPGSLGLLGAGLLAMGFVWRTRRRAMVSV